MGHTKKQSSQLPEPNNQSEWMRMKIEDLLIDILDSLSNVDNIWAYIHTRLLIMYNGLPRVCLDWIRGRTKVERRP